MESRGQQATLFGHPVGLFTLFFAEMWERFSYYGMRALLTFYMLKGFLGYNDSQAYGVYGAYTALVYATPFIGGILADKLLGARRAVIIGGILMSMGHLLMTIETSGAFFTALGLLIVGNGFFKPNISTIVGGLYPPGSTKKDAGFTLFYMGINLGAAMSPLVCGYIGETYGWHYGFGLATFGMLTGLAVFAAPRRLAQAIVLIGCVGAAAALFKFQNNIYQLVINGIVGVSMLIAGVVGFIALQRGGVPEGAGLPPDPEAAKQHAWKVYVAIVISVPILAFLVQRNALAGVMLSIFGAAAFGWITLQAFQRERVHRERLFVVLILMFFSMLFWACFEQAGSSVNNFTDRNVDRVLNNEDTKVITADQVGQKLKFDINQKQLGYKLKLDHDQLYTILAPSLIDLPNKTLLRYSKEQLTGIPLELTDEQKAGSVPSGITATDDEVQELGKHLQSFIDYLVEKRSWEALGMKQEDFELLSTDKQLAKIYEKMTNKTLPTDDAALRQQLKSELGLTDQELEKKKRVDELQTLLMHAPVGLTKEHLKEISTEQLEQLAKDLLGYTFDKDHALLVTLNVRDALREKKIESLEITITKDHVGMTVGGAEVPASIFQSVNPIFIILFAPLLSGLWEKLGAIGKDPSTPVKFALGVMQLGLGFTCFWRGAATCDERGMVWVGWLILGYLFQTTGELCLSPVGLSMVTKLSPADIVSTVMGAWFMATAFSNYLAGMIAKLTGVSEGGGGGNSIPAPVETVHLYGDVFGKIAITAIAVGVLCFLFSPLLKKWMHQDVAEG